MSDRFTPRRDRYPSLGRVLAVVAVVALLLTVFAPRLVAQDGASNSDWSPPRTVYIPETGQTIDGVFLDFWRSWGGAAAFGYPITPELQEHGHTVQYYGYARFEYWPQDPDGSVVHLGRIGAELRPAMLRRALPGFGRDAARGTQAARDAVAAARAWLPIKPQQVPDDDAYRYVEATKHSIYEGFRDFWEATGAETYLGNPLTEEYVQDGASYQIFERGALTWKQGADVTMVPVGKMLAKRYGLAESPVDQGDLPTYSEDIFQPPPTPTPEPTEVPTPAATAQVINQDANADGGVYGVAPVAGAAKSIVVSISQQTMWAFEGNVVVNSSLVSTGREGFETPTGMFAINSKLPVQDMSGVIGGEYYNVPQVPWVMYFTDVGHALHGTYWHNNFGTPMSHGCVNLPMDVAEWMYGWAPEGTPVEIIP